MNNCDLEETKKLAIARCWELVNDESVKWDYSSSYFENLKWGLIVHYSTSGKEYRYGKTVPADKYASLYIYTSEFKTTNLERTKIEKDSIEWQKGDNSALENSEAGKMFKILKDRYDKAKNQEACERILEALKLKPSPKTATEMVQESTEARRPWYKMIINKIFGD